VLIAAGIVPFGLRRQKIKAVVLVDPDRVLFIVGSIFWSRKISALELSPSTRSLRFLMSVIANWTALVHRPQNIGCNESKNRHKI